MREKKPKITRDICALFETEEEKKKAKKEAHERIIKDRMIRDIKTLFEQQEDHYDLKRVMNFWNNDYIEYESNDDKK